MNAFSKPRLGGRRGEGAGGVGEDSLAVSKSNNHLKENAHAGILSVDLNGSFDADPAFCLVRFYRRNVIGSILLSASGRDANG
jgi:hypothetical protein